MNAPVPPALAPAAGTPARTAPLPPWPHFDAEQVEAAAAVLRSGRVNYWTGETGRQFEAEFARFAGVAHAVALANGTLALDLALRVLGIGPGDDVVVTPRSYMASVSSVVLAGARPVFADVDPDSQNLTAASIEAALTPATRAVVVVHLAGWPCDMPAIMALAEARGLKVIEDCAQAHGARIAGRPVGSFGHAAAWSFCQDKIMTTGGEGGMFTTDDPALWRAAWEFKDHGKRWDAMQRRDHPPGFRWLHGSFGSNWRLTEMQCALGRVQLARMPEWTAARTRNALRLAERLRRWPALRVPLPGEGLEHAWYKLYAFVRPETLGPGWTRDALLPELEAQGIPALTGSCPEIYLEAAFDGTGWRPERRLPVARALGETSLMFLVHPTLSDADIDDVATAVDRVMDRASRPR